MHTVENVYQKSYYKIEWAFCWRHVCMHKILSKGIWKIVRLAILKSMAFVMDCTDLIIEKLTKEKNLIL
jgi:aminopeptidase-like protein